MTTTWCSRRWLRPSRLATTSDKTVVSKIADLIVDGLDELVRMPPEPQAAVARREIHAEVLLRGGTAGGAVLSHQQLALDPLEDRA